MKEDNITMKKNLKAFVSSFMVGVMAVTSTAVPGLSVVSYADEVNVESEDAVVDEVASGAAVNTETTGTEENSNDESELELLYTTQTGNKWTAENLTEADLDDYQPAASVLKRVLPDTVLLESDLVTMKAAQPLELREDEGTGAKALVTTGTNTSTNLGNARLVASVTAKKDVKIKFNTFVNENKVNAVFKYDGGSYTSISTMPVDGSKATAKEAYVHEVEIAAGETIFFGGIGTNPWLYSAEFEDNTVEEPVDFGDLTVPEAGKTYTADFQALAADDTYKDKPINGVKFGEGTIMGVDATETSVVSSNGHGTIMKDGATFKIAVAGDATISMTACVHSNSGVWTLTDAAGKVIGTMQSKNQDAEGHENEADKSETAQSIDYKGGATVLTLTLDKGQGYVHNLSVANAALPTGQAESFELWFDDVAKDADGGVDADGNKKVIKTFEQQEFKFGDSSVKMVGNKNTAYDDGLERFTPNNNNANFMNLTRNGKTVNAYKAGNRHATANDIPTIPDYGDGTAMVFKCVGNGTFVSYVYTTSFVRIWDFDTETGERIGYTDTDVTPEFVAFAAEAGHTYVLSTTGKTNNCGFCGAEFAVDEEKEVTVDAWKTPADSTYNFDNSTFSLVDVFLGNTVATIKKDTKSVKLNVGHTYEIKSADAGVGATFVSTESEKVKIDKDTKTLQLNLVEIPDVELKGTIMTSDGKASDVTSIKFKNKVSGNETAATISQDRKSYTVSIKPGDYSTVIESTAYTTKDNVKVVSDKVNENVIYLKANDPTMTYLTTDIVKDAGEREFTYVAGDSTGTKVPALNNSTSIKTFYGDKIVIPVNGKKKVTVAGWYSGSWNINGKNEVTTNSSANASNPTTNSYFTDGSETSVTINITADTGSDGKAITTYLYWVKVEDVTDFDANNTVLQVPSEQFPTLKSANNYIATLRNRPDGEEGRMTIELTADIEEQIVFDQPYTTVKGNGHTISWYYGVGSFYYSIDKGTGLYDEELFYDKYNANEGDGSLWGGVAIIRGDHFRTENTTYKNTYNYEVTAKDAADFDHSAGGLIGTREAGKTDVAIYSGKERSNAFYIEAKDIQVYNCKILASQDTFGRNGSADGGYSVYVKDSVIGGNVDYICGEFKAVFDNCELQWKTYSDSSYKNKNNAAMGYIVAPKTNPYVFRNCKVTLDNKDATDEKGAAPQGKFGRTWGKDSNATFMYTQTNGYISNDAWGRMSAADTAKFYEYSNFNGDKDFPLSVETSVPEVQAKELDNDMFEAYATDDVFLDTLGFVPENHKVEEGGFKVIDNASDIRTGVYTIGNDTVIIAAYKELSPRPVVFTIDGNIAGVTKKAYDSIQFEDGTVITAKEFGLDSGYVSAIRVVGVRSENMSADAVSDREAKTNGFKATLGFPEVADEAKQSVLEEIVNNENTES